MSQTSSVALRPLLCICALLTSDSLAQSIVPRLSHDRYKLVLLRSDEQFFSMIDQEKQQLDCLILQEDGNLPQVANWLHGQAILLPAVIIGADKQQAWAAPAAILSVVNPSAPGDRPFTYHTAEVRVSTPPDALDLVIDQAISQFLSLTPACRLNPPATITDITYDLTVQNFLMLQQRRLTEKLKERLGYLGVYYKRNPQNFLRHLSPAPRQEFLAGLKTDYRELVLRYFGDDGTLNQRIDDLVNAAFFADVSVAQIVEIHMELMDEFSKQLKLEGRSEDILLDYRLTLIDTIAHLCELYRRSVPRES